MAKGQLGAAIQKLRIALGALGAEQLSDRELLRKYAAEQDEVAFTVLLRRHGALVLGICQRILQNGHDAEEAFQATFLVLARSAGSSRWQASISAWLHETARRIALKARGQRSRRRASEDRACQYRGSAPAAEVPLYEVTWGELRQVLDEELDRLPEKFRAPLILCYLEGKTQDEAAQLLGWSSGALRGRVNRGRALLCARLARRGFTLPAVLGAVMLAPGAQAALPSELARCTVQAAMQTIAGQPLLGAVSANTLNLVQAALHAAFLAKIKLTVAPLLLAALLTTGVAFWGHGASEDRPAPTVAPHAQDALLVDHDNPPENPEPSSREVPMELPAPMPMVQPDFPPPPERALVKDTAPQAAPRLSKMVQDIRRAVEGKREPAGDVPSLQQPK